MKESGAQGRKRRAAEAAALGDDELAHFDEMISAELFTLGPPPVGDPARLTVWQQAITGVATWAFATGNLAPAQVARLKGILESVRTGGMVAVKAIDRDLLGKIAERLGMKDKPDDGLDPLPPDAPTGGTNHRSRKPAS